MKTWLIGGCVLALATGCRDDASGQDPTDTDPTHSSDSGDTADGDSSGDSGDVPPLVLEPRAGRLTDLQYRYTVLDVLGVELTEDELDQLPADIPTGRDYSTTLEPQFFNANYVLAYARIARSVTARLEPATLVTQFGGCGQVDPVCRPALIEALGRRLFRRPLLDEQTSRYLELAEAIAQAPQTDEDDVVRGVTQALLQAPPFLYRIERETDGEPGDIRAIDGYELASRLSYFLWLSAPDEALLEFAAGPGGDGAYDPAAVDGQIERMVADPKFARARRLFWGDYTLASRSGFGTDDAALADQLRTSLRLTLERISAEQPEPLSALFDGQQLVMTGAVAELAGASPTADGPEVYDVADAEQRLGVVTHPAFLAAIGTDSFVGRGLFLTERLLCQRVAEPPVEVEEEIENTAQATESMTPREASEFRMGLEPVCLGCHTQFEPIAYAFERYDMAGRYTLTDASGRPLYADGVLPAFESRPEIPFMDAPQLLSELAGLEAAHACLVENMTEFGTGLRASRGDAYHDLATAAFADEGLTFDALVRAVAGSEQRTLMQVVEP